MPNLEFLGATQCVTGSKIIISDENTRVMMDCGASQGNKVESYKLNKEFNDNIPQNINSIIISHAHQDHVGLTPCMVKGGYKGKIYSTKATRDLSNYMLADSANVMLKELQILTRLMPKPKKGEELTVLYDEHDVNMTLCQFQTEDYEKDVELSKSVKFSFHDSCHILGSASIKLTATEHNIPYRVYYTSDLGHNRSILSNEPSAPQDIDYLIIESTYGNKAQDTNTDIYQEVMNVILSAYQRGGNVLIPAFSVARLQTILIIIHKLYVLGMIPFIPVYVDTPLGVKATSVYEKYIDELNDETMKFFKDKNINPFRSTLITYLAGGSDCLHLMDKEEPHIILSSAGMLGGGKIIEHAKNIIDDKKSTILFVGYNAHETLGRRIQENTGTVTIEGEKYNVRAKIETITGLSAHCDLNYLLTYIENCVSQNALKQIFLVHGEPESTANVKLELAKRNITNVTIAERNKVYKL